MKLNHKVLLPLYILLAIFLLDKIFLIPAVQDCCVKKTNDVFYQESHDNAFHQKAMYNKAKASGKKILMNFGSSMSYGYYYFQPGTRNFNALQDTSRKQDLKPLPVQRTKQWHIINFAYPGASMLTTYIRLNQILHRGVQPDLVSIEFAPTTFNHRAPWSKNELAYSMPSSFFWRHIHDIPASHISVILLSKAFVLYHKKIGRSDPLDDALGNVFNKFLYDPNRLSADLPPNLTRSYKPGEESNYDKMLELAAIDNLQKNLQDFKPSPEHSHYFISIQKELEKKKIPMVIWYPRVHPNVYQTVQNLQQKDAMQPLIKKLNNQSLYINMNTDTGCNSYIDPIHMSLHCFKELFLKTIAAYPDQ